MGEFDVAIIGGGPAGGLAAITLAAKGFSCALIDAVAPKTTTADGFDGRTTALSYANGRLFRRMGLWDAIAHAAEPINDILVTDGQARGRFKEGHVSPFNLHFDSRELDDETPLGWIVENTALRRALYSAIEKDERITLIAPAARIATNFNKPSADIMLNDNRSLSAKLVLAADGKNSPLREEVGLRTNRWRYDQHGIVVTVAHERPHKGVAQEFFLPSGPFAILPFTENRSSLVWTEKSSAVPAYLGLSDEAFRAEIESRFGPYLGKVSLAGPRFSYPLTFHIAQRFIAPRLALIGDAARTIHPIAGQGYNLGVKDIAAMADVLTNARAVGLDIGSLTVLADYERWRHFDSAMLAFGTDALNRLFSNDIGPLRFARSFGMGLVNRITPLRHMFMKQAGADLGRLPSLLQAEETSA